MSAKTGRHPGEASSAQIQQGHLTVDHNLLLSPSPTGWHVNRATPRLWPPIPLREAFLVGGEAAPKMEAPVSEVSGCVLLIKQGHV